MLSYIHSVLKACFKSLNDTKLHTLAKGITCVAMGIRTSHLIDIAYLDYNKAKGLLLELRKHPDGHSLLLLQFKDRFTFICHKERLHEHIKITLTSNPWQYISVDGNTPILSEDYSIHVIHWIQDQLLPFISTHQVDYYSSILPTYMVSLTGWLLEYPIIYTTHSLEDKQDAELDEWEVKTNCLGNESLQVIQLWIDDYMLLSYSYPLSFSFTSMDIQLKAKIDSRLIEINQIHPDYWNNHSNLRREHIKLDRFAL
ncbi:hypothetical protein BDB01DRAFT_850481 [Pilobolus umbonatus]|nr:hypothetical protein BDB01DRAFT_850481 [Pilobolus umbonatus]